MSGYHALIWRYAASNGIRFINLLNTNASRRIDVAYIDKYTYNYCTALSNVLDTFEKKFKILCITSDYHGMNAREMQQSKITDAKFHHSHHQGLMAEFDEILCAWSRYSIFAMAYLDGMHLYGEITIILF